MKDYSKLYDFNMIGTMVNEFYAKDKLYGKL